MDALREAVDRAGVAELMDDALSSLTALLRKLDRYQQDDNLYGAWYYARDVLEDVLGLERGSLDNPRSDDPRG
jgi:hypothetical protein